MNDIESLIKNQVQESLNLDYKRTKSLENNDHNKNEISKDVSAFANSDGGTIIYGVIEKNHIPEKIDEGVDVKGKREWLEQVINSRIKPRIQNVVITPIDLKKQSGKAIFLVEIPVGTTAYQASDYKYYKRFNFQSVPMYDYEVKMTINRYKEPKIELKMELSINNTNQHCLEIYAENTAPISASAAHFKLFIPEDFFGYKQGENWLLGDKMGIKYKDEYVAVLMYNWRVPYNTELFPEFTVTLSSKLLSDTIALKNTCPKFEKGSIDIPIFYEIYTSNARPRKGKYIFTINRVGKITYTQIEEPY